jgi:hypothetical protein
MKLADLLEAVKDLLNSTEDSNFQGCVVVGATEYNKLREVVHKATGEWHGDHQEENFDDDE